MSLRSSYLLFIFDEPSLIGMKTPSILSWIHKSPSSRYPTIVMPLPPPVQQESERPARFQAYPLTPDPSAEQGGPDLVQGDDDRQDNEGGGNWGVHAQHDGESVAAGPRRAGSIISYQLPMSPGMSISGMIPPGTATSFPNVRGPNLNRLTKGSYRYLSIPSASLLMLPSCDRFSVLSVAK